MYSILFILINPDYGGLVVAGMVLATLPDSTLHRRLQVVLIPRRGGLSFDLREQQYTEGIGWSDQRALELDPRQLRLLLEILGPGLPTRVREQAETPTILRFP